MLAPTKLLLGLLVTILLLSGCSDSSWAGAGKIVPPVNNNSPLQGEWIVKRELETGRRKEGGSQTWVGKTAQFASNVAALGEYVWHNPDYKIKRVNSTDYLMSKYVNLSSPLVPNGREVYVVTLSSAENFLVEVMEIDSSHAIAFIQNRALYLEKVSPQVDLPLIAAIAGGGTQAAEGSSSASSGVLLGLRAPVTAMLNGKPSRQYVYRTLWLASRAGKFRPVLQRQDIFFPRRSGFWQLEVRWVEEAARTEDVFLAYDVSTKTLGKEKPAPDAGWWRDRAGTLRRKIDYVGNDYVAVENNGQGTRTNGGGTWTKQDLQVLPVDKISSSVGIKLSDVAGRRGAAVFSAARAQASRLLSREGFSDQDADPFDQNFGLIRRNGHWYFQGRINYQGQGKPAHMDFNVNLIPPAKLIFYDTLYLSWQNVKDRVPDAVDAFTSPNRNLALVLTKSKLYVYAMHQGQLSGNPEARIALRTGESVVMAEWATGVYVENWEKAFLADGAKVLAQ
ncbi:hypothetical protein CEB3_c22490 [Peptococcaceae bacterium CEB3]|nr:hypothetical protein CEB3_c22490 [Peptococcaceae bacterium CEB3]